MRVLRVLGAVLLALAIPHRHNCVTNNRSIHSELTESHVRKFFAVMKLSDYVSPTTDRLLHNILQFAYPCRWGYPELPWFSRISWPELRCLAAFELRDKPTTHPYFASLQRQRMILDLAPRCRILVRRAVVATKCGATRNCQRTQQNKHFLHLIIPLQTRSLQFSRQWTHGRHLQD